MNAILLAILAVCGVYLVANQGAAGGSLSGLLSSIKSVVANVAPSEAQTEQANLGTAESIFGAPISVAGSGSGANVAVGQQASGSVAGNDSAIVGSIVSSGAGIVATLLASSPATGPAAPFVAAAAGLVAIFTSVFKGANPLQVDASEIEQIYEALADDVYAVHKLGMISQSDAVSAMQSLITAGQKAESEYSGQLGDPAGNGAANLTAVIQAEISAVEQVPDPESLTPIDISQAHAVYVGGTGKWYPSSISAANTMMDAFLTELGGTAA